MKESEDELRVKVSLGVNPFDLTYIPPIILGNVLKEPRTGDWRIDRECVIIIDKDKPDEQCVPFGCGLLSAALCLDLLRNELRQSNINAVVRGYMKKGKGDWKRLPHNAILTIQDKGAIKLNPQWFPIHEEPEPLVAPVSDFVFKGRKG